MVDSDVRSAKIRASVLELSGYEVQLADDPRSAVQTLTKVRPNVLLCNLGPQNDIESFRELRARANELPVVALVDSPSGDRPSDLADHFVTKVDGPRALLKHLDDVVRFKHHAHAELEGERVVFVDSDRRYVEATQKACELIGYQRKELLGMRIDDVSAPNSDVVARKFQQYVDNKQQEGVFVLKHKNGNEVPIRYRALVLPDGCLAAEWDPLGSSTLK
jgi:PAS domain S-box-containing protein